MALLSVAEALRRVTAGIEPLEAERVPLETAHDRILAEDIAAKLTQPPFDASAMDGYAVRSADIAALPARLKLIGESAAGARFEGKASPGETVRIFTGAPMPEGADTVVIQENTAADGEIILIKDAEAGRHIRPRGQDFAAGQMLLKAGTRLGARALMLAAAMNHDALPVRRKPKVAILATGDEVVPPGSTLAPDQIVSSVPYGIAALVDTAGGEALPLGIAKDDPASIVALARAGRDADILLTIGGASVGERDLVASTLIGEGLKLDFAKVAIRPGKPMLFGRLGAQRVLGVPGNPVSAMVCAHVFLVPMLDRLLGRVTADPIAEALLAEDLEANGPRAHYIRAISERRADGTRMVRPLPSQDSSLVAALAQADCLIVRPPDAPAAARGIPVSIIPFDAD